jgi:2-polyprenyl-6-methoxyphenol hydroxylase-like FAD-dependent oxidoreductase
MKVIIAGGGIGGLTAALSLHKLGMDVTVYESTPRIEPLGVGINLLPHGARALFELGLEDELSATGVKTRVVKYLTKRGQEILEDPRGLNAGFNWPQFSIHRGHLQLLLRDAVIERMGPESVLTGHHLAHFHDSGDKVRTQFVDKANGNIVAEPEADLLIAADGIRSAARRQFYPDEGPACFSGVMMWRGAAETEAVLDGETMLVAGHFLHKAVIYPISEPLRRQGRSLTNWVMEIRIGGNEAPEVEDWNRRGELDEILPVFGSWDFDSVNIPAILKATDTIHRYPMVDRDPLPKWSFGRVTLLGDAAHPMYPMGANGASQAILDCVALADAFRSEDKPENALQRYEEARLGATAEVVRSNRGYGPEAILQIVEDRMTSDSDRVEDVISREEIDEITLGYRKIAGFDVEELNK